MKWPKGIVAVAVAALALTGCGEAAQSEKAVKVAIVNYVSHPALDAAQAGFLEELKEAGYVEGKNLAVELQNANGDQATLTSIASTFAASDADLFYAIATPSAQSLAQAITDRPIVFAAVTDPVSAELVQGWEVPGGNVTGVSDLNPMKEQLELVREVLPEAKRLGIVYSSGEVNSAVQVREAEQAAGELGLTVLTATVTNSNEVAQAAQSLDVDAFLIPTDNVVVSAAESVIQVASSRRIPVFASDEATTERGAAAGLSVNYTQQGRDAAKLAVRILAGDKPGDLAVETQKEFDLFVNVGAAQEQGVTLPEAVVARAAKKF